MTAFPSFAAGNQITAQKLNDMQAAAFQATASQSVTNSTTFVSDNTLTVPVVANANYFIEFFMGFSQSSTNIADLKTIWGVPSGTQGIKQCIGPTSASTRSGFVNRRNTDAQMGGHLLGSTVTYCIEALVTDPISGVPIQTVIIEKAVVSTAGTAGNVVIRFAQNTAQAQNLVRLAGSFARVTRYN